jgi:hypothetical protein
MGSLFDKSAVIEGVCNALSLTDDTRAAGLLNESYPHLGALRMKRTVSITESMKVFWRDGFIDVYSGQRLVFPGTLRLLSILMPEEFPFHPLWRMDITHPAFWELFPTIDHEMPIARGGLDIESNWATTSQLRNSAKANWTLDELGWRRYPPGDPKEWDGLTSWFLRFVARRKEFLNKPYLRLWHNAAAALLEDVSKLDG